MKVLELFGGIGACTQALKRLGVDVEIADYVEIDKYAVKSYNAINGTNFEPQDITEWDKDIDVDLIMHGSPCQDISLAGQQAGADEGSGTRSSLMYETIRIVKKLKPKYVIWENVKNLISKKHKHNFDNYIQTLEQLGYKSYWQVLNAKDYGIPQNRERVFTISIRKDIDKEFIFPQKQELKLRLKDLLEDEVDEKYYLSNKGVFYFKQQAIQRGENINEAETKKLLTIGHGENKGSMKDLDISPTLDTNFSNFWRGVLLEPVLVKNKGQELVKKTDIATTLLARDYKDLGNQNGNAVILIKNANSKGYDEAIEGDSIDLAYPNSNTRRGRVGHQVSQTIPTSNNKGVVVIGNYMPSNHDASRIVDNEYLAPTVKENHGTVTATIVKDNNRNAKHQQDLLQRDEGCCRTIPAGTHGSTPHLLKTIVNENPLRIRKLTPKECWRLMGFSDEAFDKASQVNSNTQLYKQAGNSIVVNVLEAIFKELLEE